MSLVTDVARPPVPALREQLRHGVSDAHARLEGALDLIGRLSDRRHFLKVLEGFLGFHLVWEQAIRRNAAVGCFVEPRSRLPHLRRDLAALGRTNSEVARLPLCAEAAALASGAPEAVGSIYVLEGSTLGGQVIGRGLAQAGWAPPGGLAYFNPYGGRTGEMWRGFGRWAEDMVPAEQRPAAVQGAQRTFAVLQRWLTA
jgi:heme oxygenase